MGTNKCQQYVPTLFVDNKGTEGGYNICQQYVPTLFVDNNGTEGGYKYMSTVCTDPVCR